MTRFDASAAAERQSLVVAVIEAHRERGSIFCTVEADTPPGGPIEADTPPGGPIEAGDEAAADVGEGSDGVEGTSAEDGEAVETDASDVPAWIQFSDAESQLNLDCTDEEYDRITDVLASAPAFTIDEQASPEDADGRNLRVTTYADPERIATVVDRIFLEGFDYDEEFRLWATEI